jgi:SAM-dependent methyltransferase
MERLMFDMETARWECEIAQYDADHLRLRQVAMILKSLSVESVFDIGCGHGHLGTLLPGVRYSGCDMIDGAGASFSFTRCNVNRDSLPTQIGEASAVSCSGILEYVDDLPRFLGELRSCMRSEAWLVGTYYNMNHLSRIFDLALGRTFDAYRGWRGFYSTRALGHLLNASGFRMENRYVTRFGMEEPLLSDTVSERLRLPRYFPGGYLLAHQIIYVARAVG